MQISIIIPLYNGANYLRQTLHSIFDQTLLPAEIIVVNDGSTDQSPQIVESLKANAPCPLHLLNQANAGTQAARNTGIKQANSPYVALLDQDDYWDRTFLAETAALIAPNRVVYASYQNIDENGQPVGKIVHPHPNNFGFPRLLLGNQVFPSLALLPREKLIEVGLFDTAFLASGDWDMWIRLLLGEVGFIPVKKKLVNYRLHPQNTSKDQRLMLNDHRGVINKTLNAPDLPRRLLRFSDKIRASDHLYAATRLWRMYAANSDREIMAEMQTELKQAVKLYPGEDFWTVLLLSMISNSNGKPQEALNFSTATLAEDLPVKPAEKLQALAALLAFRYTRRPAQLWHIAKNTPKLAPFILKYARRKLKNKSWLEE
jgi:glycosyltransferase involved in cell wall biosynthesis